jgi:hypothetical protein
MLYSLYILIIFVARRYYLTMNPNEVMTMMTDSNFGQDYSKAKATNFCY